MFHFYRIDPTVHRRKIAGWTIPSDSEVSFDLTADDFEARGSAGVFFHKKQSASPFFQNNCHHFPCDGRLSGISEHIYVF